MGRRELVKEMTKDEVRQDGKWKGRQRKRKGRREVHVGSRG